MIPDWYFVTKLVQRSLAVAGAEDLDAGQTASTPDLRCLLRIGIE